MRRNGRRTSSRTPTFARIFVVIAVLLTGLVSSAAPARGQDVLTESDVVRIARTRSPDSAVAEEQIALADARERTAGLLLNPRAAWQRETLGGSNVQDILQVTVPIDVAGPLTTRSLAASQSAWMRAKASAQRTGAVLEALVRYYDVVVARRQVRILEQAEANLEEGARVLSRREAAGMASGYESTRLAIARELARSRTAQARGAWRAARARLAGWLGLDPAALRVDPDLALSAMPSEEELAQLGVTMRETAKHARASARAAEQAEDRARWTWLPTVWATGGWNGIRNPDLQQGYVLGIAMTVPLFDRGQDRRAEARARRALARARARAIERAIATDVAARLAAYEAAREELARFESATAEPAEVLLQSARSGYREGERTLVELLDAQRARTDVALRRLELLGVAKRAEAELRAASGGLQ